MLSVSSFARITLPLAIAALALTACTGGSTSTATTDIGGGAGTVTLIHFNDLHAHLSPHLDRVAVPATSAVAATTRLQERGDAHQTNSQRKSQLHSDEHW